MRRLSFVVLCAAILFCLSAAAAFAGEVKGPPGQLNNTNDTAAPTHANSPCAFSGLNDMDTSDPGQLVSQVQTAADSWRYYNLPKGTPGTACNPTKGGGE